MRKTCMPSRAWIEAQHEKTHGKSQFAEQSQAIFTALNGRYDKGFVLKTVTEVLGIEPVEKDGIYCFGKWEVSFDQNDRLAIMSASSGGPVVIQVDVKHTGDT